MTVPRSDPVLPEAPPAQCSEPQRAHCVQVSQLSELLVLLGHEADAQRLQSVMDTLLKLFLEAAADLLENNSPPANGAVKARLDAEATDAGIRHKCYELTRVQWKWDLLREAPAVGGL